MKTIIPVGPFHPLQEEPEFFQLQVEGETIVDVDVRLGYNHRGIEKVSETLTYHQIPFLVERICGICSASHPLAYIQAVEDIAHVQVPERALYIRTIINELERVHSHMLWVGLAGHFIGYNTVFMWAWRYREPIMDIIELATGSRVNYANNKVGGVIRDIPKESLPQILKALDDVKKPLDMITGAVMDDPVLHARLKNVGILTKKDAVGYCTVGPTVRASGIPIDVRRDEPYAAYDKVDWKVITTDNGDVFDKAVVRILETYESIKIIEQCIKNLPDGPLDAKVGDIPEGEGIGHVEAPRGETFHYVRSNGTNRPMRHKVRAPSYVNVPSFKATCIGQTISDATLILAAVDPCYSCTERMAALDTKTGRTLYDAKDLMRMCREKTEKIKAEMGMDWRY